MKGFPPSPEGQVTLANWRKPPFNRWAFQHVREIVPSADIPHDPGAVRELPEALVDLSDLTVDTDRGKLSLDAFLEDSFTDAMIVLHQGRIAFQHYANGMTSATPHILMSVSKSVLGLITGVAVDQGKLDPDALVTDHVPEVGSTAYTGATIRHLLDMRAGVSFDEDYLATSGPIIQYRKSTNWNPLEPGETASDLRAFYQTLTERDGEHGRPWHYVSPNPDLLAWVLERATGQRYADLASELLWRRIGAAHSAYITVDRLGAPRAAGGVCCTAPDLARLGLMFAEGGNRVVSAERLDDIVAGGNPKAWAESTGFEDYGQLPMRYRSQWYVLDRPSPLAFGIGIHGQSIYVDRETGFVMVKFSSQPLPLDPTRKLPTLELAEKIRDRMAGP